MLRHAGLISVAFITSALLLWVKPVRSAEADVAAISALHVEEAAAYSFFPNDRDQTPLEFQPQPIFKWQNLTHPGGQLGAIFVWTRGGRPEVLGSTFSLGENGKRLVIHEFHTLSPDVVRVQSPPGLLRRWQPTAGLALKTMDKAPAVATTPAQRMFQMRSLARDFSAFTQREGERIELRLAPQPLIRYQPTRPDVLDGALFAFLSSAAGTDPEVLLLIEARKADPKSDEWIWHQAIVRFSDRDLVVLHKDVEQYSSITDPQLGVKIEDQYRWIHTADQTYSVFRAKVIDELTKPADNP